MAEPNGADFLNFVDEVQSEVGGYDKVFESPYIDSLVKKQEGTEFVFRLYTGAQAGAKPYQMVRYHKEAYRELGEGEKPTPYVLCNGEDAYCRRAKEYKAVGEMDKASKQAPERQFWFSAVLTNEPGVPRFLRATQGVARKMLLLIARAGGYGGSDEVEWTAMTDSFKAGLVKGFGVVYGNEGRDFSLKFRKTLNGKKCPGKKMYAVDLLPKESSPVLEVDATKFKDLSVAAVESFTPREREDQD